jgi:hypothetical protein
MIPLYKVDVGTGSEERNLVGLKEGVTPPLFSRAENKFQIFQIHLDPILYKVMFLVPTFRIAL